MLGHDSGPFDVSTYYKEMIDKHDCDLYHGDDRRAGITLRVEMLENTVTSQRASYEKLVAGINKILWGIAAIIAGGLYDVIVRPHLR